MNPDDKRPLGFVNRHGHQANLETIDLSDTPSNDVPENKTNSKKSPKIRRKRHLKWTRKKTLILVIVIVIIVAIPITAGEVLRGQYLTSANDAKNALHNLIENDVLPAQQKPHLTAKELSDVTDKIEKVRDDMCPGSAYDNLALMYPRSKSAHQACIDQRGKIASLVTQLRDMEGSLRYVEELNAALASVAGTGEGAFAVIATQQTNWQHTYQSVQKLHPPTALSGSHQQLVGGVKTIVDGWSKLNIANNNQDAPAFESAEKQLATGYKAIRATEETFARSINEKQATIIQFAVKL